MILGEHPLRLDEKGRLILPAKWRHQFAEGLVITKGQERCLCLWPAAEFTRRGQPLAEAPVTDRRLRDYGRVFFSSASDETLDRQGRLTVPAGLRGYAGLTRDCMAVGLHNRAEVWSADAWRDYLGAKEPEFSDLTEEVLPGGVF